MPQAQSPEQLEEMLEAHARALPELVPHCRSEAQTRSTLIDPYLEYLGWDPRNPRMVLIEDEANIGPRKSEKVDYTLVREKNPLIIIEAKKAQHTLGDQAPVQLQKYFSTKNVDYAVMTNGLIWQWFQQEDDGKLLSQTPFLTINARKVKETDVAWLWNIHPDRFDRTNLNLKLKKILTLRELIAKSLREIFGKESQLPKTEDSRNETAREPAQPHSAFPSEGWLLLTEWEKGHIRNKKVNLMEIRMPDGSIQPIKSFRQLARQVINHVNAQHSGPPDPAKQIILIPGYRHRIFADAKPCGRRPHVAKNLRMVFQHGPECRNHDQRTSGIPDNL